MDRIDAYVAELSAALRGPSRAKADLLAEARDSMVDAAEAYHRRGVDTAAAQRRAVTEFGTLAEVVPGYQAELGRCQSHRTALLVVLALAPQSFIWDVAARTARAGRDPGRVYHVVDRMVEWSGGVVLVAAALGVLACGSGVRYLGVRPRLTRLVGVAAGGTAGFFALAGLLLTTLNTAAGAPLFTLTGLPWTVAFLVLPMGWVALWGRRCLAAAEPASCRRDR